MTAAFADATGREAHDAGPRRPGQGVARGAVVRAHRILGAVVLTPEGVLDDSVLRAIDRAVSAAGRTAVVLDLSTCALTRTSVLEQLDPRRWARTAVPVRVVCPRRSARRLLARAGVASRLPLFRSIEEAVEPRDT